MESGPSAVVRGRPVPSLGGGTLRITPRATHRITATGPTIGAARAELERVLAAMAPGVAGEPGGVVQLTRAAQPPAGGTSDAYTLAVRGGDVVLTGTTDRALLHAVWALEDELTRHRGELAPGFRVDERFHLDYRIFHSRFEGWPGERADVRSIARMGATHCLVDHDWHGTLRNLQGYVTSPIFVNAVDPEVVSRQRAGLEALVGWCADYGLEPALWLTELPCQGGPWVPEDKRREFLRRFPDEVLSESGTYEGKVLCFGHPRVRVFYRDLLERFFALFPRIGLLFVFGRDSSGEYCDPVSCPRCRGMSLWDQRDRFLNFLSEEGVRVRPGLRILTTGWKWDHEPEVFLSRQRRLPASCGVYLAAEKDGWQVERQTHDFLRAVRAVTAERGQLFIGYDNLHWGDDTVHGLRDLQDYPLGVGAKIRRWVDLGADGVFDHWGTWNEDVPCNSLACRAFFLDPRADPAAVCGEIAVRQFGGAAGRRVLESWRHLDRAHSELSAACTWSPGQWPGWYRGRALAPLPEVFEEILAGKPSDWRMDAEAPRRDGERLYNAGGLEDLLRAVHNAWTAADTHYRDSVKAMEEAIRVADGSPVGCAAWWGGEHPVPSRRSHLERQRLYQLSVSVIGREIGLHFGLFALYLTGGRDPAAYRTAAAAALRADRDACVEAALLVEGWGAAAPAGVRGWAAQYREKARRIREYLGVG